MSLDFVYKWNEAVLHSLLVLVSYKLEYLIKLSLEVELCTLWQQLHGRQLVVIFGGWVLYPLTTTSWKAVGSLSSRASGTVSGDCYSFVLCEYHGCWSGLVTFIWAKTHYHTIIDYRTNGLPLEAPPFWYIDHFYTSCTGQVKVKYLLSFAISSVAVYERKLQMEKHNTSSALYWTFDRVPS